MTAEQRDSSWVAGATPEMIDDAYTRGQLDDLLGLLEPHPPTRKPTTDAEYAAALGLTLEEFGQINSLESQAKIAAKLKAENLT